MTKDPAIERLATVEDELSLYGLWEVLVRQKKWVIGISMLFVLLAGVYAFSAKPKWEATAVIQVGQVGQSGVGQPSQTFEPPIRTVERMKMESFEDDVIAGLKLPIESGNPSAHLFRSSLSLKVLGTTDLIQIRVKGYSRDQATIFARKVVDQIKEVHEKLMQPAIERLEKQRAELNKHMGTIEEERGSLSKIILTSTASSGESKFSEQLLLSNLLIAKNAELRDFEMRRLAVNEQLTWIRTFRTSIVSRVYVPEVPASPKKVLTVLLAAIVGLAFGAVAAFLRDWQTRKDRA